MPDILLINPNTSSASTDMMVRIAAACSAGLPGSLTISGCTAGQGPAMIVNEAELAAAALQVQLAWQAAAVAAEKSWAGIVVSAFGDPGMETLRATTSLPVVGICEASLLEAAQGGRRFGIATVTPELAGLIQQRVDELGLGAAYTGIRLTPGEPRTLAANPAALQIALAEAVNQCIVDDGAEAVIIGGGPLAQAATQLQARWGIPIIEPIPAAVRQLVALLNAEAVLN
ncbi:MAG: aspartate/glutamate racemase family protein [Pseudomonadota bacterium]